MLGREKRMSPQFIMSSEGSWFGTSVCIDRMTQSSSACSRSFGKALLISRPLSPHFAKAKGDGYAAPVFRSVRRLKGRGFPAYFDSAGLGSKVSTCDAPPLGKMWIMRLARAGKWERRGASGFSPTSSPPFARAWPIRSCSAKAPTPSVQRARRSRRVGFIGSVQKEELVRQQQGLGILLEGAQWGRRRTAELGGRVPGDFLAGVRGRGAVHLDHRRPGELVVGDLAV